MLVFLYAFQQGCAHRRSQIAANRQIFLPRAVALAGPGLEVVQSPAGDATGKLRAQTVCANRHVGLRHIDPLLAIPRAGHAETKKSSIIAAPPLATAFSWTKRATAMSRTPRPNGENILARRWSGCRRPEIRSPIVPSTKALEPVVCSARCTDVCAFRQCSTSSTTFCAERITSTPRSRSDT